MESGKEIIALFDDGFQYSDIWNSVSKAMAIVEQLDDLSGEEKKETVISIINNVIDEVDIPWVPDSMVDPILKKLVPGAIEYLLKASKGQLGIG